MGLKCCTSSTLMKWFKECQTFHFNYLIYVLSLTYIEISPYIFVNFLKLTCGYNLEKDSVGERKMTIRAVKVSLYQAT